MHKKKDFDKQLIAKKLDKLADNISKRGIFVVNKGLRYFQILNYTNNNIIFDEIPNKEIANSLCNTLNSNKNTGTSWMKEVKDLLKYYAKLDYDCIYYTYTIENTDDAVLRDITNMRREVTVDAIKRTVQKLKVL